MSFCVERIFRVAYSLLFLGTLTALLGLDPATWPVMGAGALVADGAGIAATVSIGFDEAAIGTDVLAGRLPIQTTSTIKTITMVTNQMIEPRIFIGY